MSVEEDTELRDLVSKTLENNGVLAKIRAELRASVFLALEEQESKTTPFENKALKEYLNSPQAALGLCIVREFLEYLELDFTLSVYNTETSHGKGYEYSGRSKLIKDLHIKSLNGKKGPLLTHILQIAQESNGIAQDKEGSPKLGPSISKFCSESGSFNTSHEGTCVESPNVSLAPLDRTFTSDGPTLKVGMSSTLNDDDYMKGLSVKPESPQTREDSEIPAQNAKPAYVSLNESNDATVDERKSIQEREIQPKSSKVEAKTSLTSLDDLPPLDNHQGRGNIPSNINFAGLGLQDEYEEDFVSSGSSAALEEKSKSLSHKSNSKQGSNPPENQCIRKSSKSDVQNSDKKTNSPEGSISEDLDDNTQSGIDDLLNSNASTNTADSSISHIRSKYADYLENEKLQTKTMDRSKILSPRKSAELIASQAQHVTILNDGVKTLAQQIYEKLQNKTISIEMFSQHELHPSSSDPSAVDWIFVVDTLNFCFWSPDGAHYSVSYKGKKYTGYFALCAALNRAKDAGKRVTDPQFYSQISAKEVKELLQGDDGSADLPLIDERAECLRQVGACLLEKYDGSFINCVKASNGSAENLLNLVVREFPCYRDEATFKEYLVSFYKRAQILVGDIWACFKGADLGYFFDIDYITMFADYRVPQVLVHFGVMQYSPYLHNLLEAGGIMESGCQEEIEIRGCSIYAVELLSTCVKSLLSAANKTDQFIINSIIIDHFLWDFRRQYAQELSSIPFHKVVSVYY
ncbi:Queuosine salvage protein [Frankliniella fusca]|uniref:Queuosine 5'-phosphate N-glycosylase/hydrolase n=1 Tax=Frankliniella fusca TaxID=407009 RepID=A0AAE1HM55_9NEOP|nr:Queuosine salvage protein [Frankliniella fusca]